MFLLETISWPSIAANKVCRCLLGERRCFLTITLEFDAFLTFHNDLRRKYLDLRVSADQMDQALEEHRIELARKDKKIQSQR